MKFLKKFLSYPYIPEIGIHIDFSNMKKITFLKKTYNFYIFSKKNLRYLIKEQHLHNLLLAMKWIHTTCFVTVKTKDHISIWNSLGIFRDKLLNAKVQKKLSIVYYKSVMINDDSKFLIF